MGWYSCYTALKQNDCKTGEELFKKDRDVFIRADGSNIRASRKAAWEIGEKHIQDDLELEEKWNKGK